MQEFIFQIVHATFFELLHVFGLFFVFGFILSLIQRSTQKLYIRTFGWKSLLFTAWIGTPIHEIGHIIFAKIFRHKIEKFSLFSPNQQTGNLGHVEHSYKKNSILPRVGLFFIGAAPLLFGALFLGLLLIFFFPNGKDIFSLLIESAQTPTKTIEALSTFFSISNIKNSGFWLCMYVSVSIVAHMAPSKQDRNNMWKGLGFLTVILFIINAATAAFGIALDTLILELYQTSALLIAFVAYSLFISFAYFIFSWLILRPIALLKQR